MVLHLQNLGLVLELVKKFIDALDLTSTGTLGRLLDLQGLDARRDIDAEILGGDLDQRLLLGLHDVGQRSIAGLVETQVGGNDGGHLGRHRFKATVDLTGDLQGLTVNLKLGGKRGLIQIDGTTFNTGVPSNIPLSIT